MTIHNPILRGFNPDPSILRVGDDYYIATSTFEWFPGVQIHHSRDLVNWRLLTRPLDRLSQLDMLGNPDSGGIWAPCLSFADGLFYLIFTDVKAWKGNAHKISHNYLVTASAITGPWSEPILLNSSGFDPSLFHDDDGRKWLLNIPRRRCKKPATARWSKPRRANGSSLTCAAGPSTANIARSAAKPRSRNVCGGTTAGSI
jgi:xylan 1,4-beta-xylosidase